MKWLLNENSLKINNGLVDACGGNEILATILYNRGITIVDEISKFLNPSSKNFRDIKAMKDVLKGFELLKEALDNGYKIGICGDYDVDGVTSTTILYKGIAYLGGDVCYHLPHRIKEGYGINIDTVKEFHNMGCKLIITCDNGIAAAAEMLYARELGIKTIILDHHEPPVIIENDVKKEIIPLADAVIDAKQSDCPYEFKQMCAGGLCYRFMKGFYEYVGVPFKLERELVVMAGLATICDIVDLQDENRLIALLAFTIINKECRNKGLKMLIEKVMPTKGIITEHSFGFILGPCINAAGRLDTALEAVELFVSEDMERIEELAEKLYEQNCERKDLTEAGVELALESIENNNLNKDKVLVVYSDEIHESVAGIVAGRIKDKFYKPSIVLTKAETGAKGSARSIECYNIFEALTEQRQLLNKFGGHSMAAGLSLDIENINELKFQLNKKCGLTDEDLIPRAVVDRILDFTDISLGKVEQLEVLHPFGKGNDEPLFVSENITVEYVRFVGQNKDIVQLSLSDSNNIKIKGIFFYGRDYLLELLKEKNMDNAVADIEAGKSLKKGFVVDILYTLRINEFNGRKSVQLNIKDLIVKG